MSEQNKFEGYKDETIKILTKFKAETWSRVNIQNGDFKAEGIITPRNKYAKDNYVNIKLDNGYTLGVKLTNKTKITVIGKENPMQVKFDQKTFKKNKKLPNITLLGTGGTIASRLDYNTGGVIPAFEPGELFTAVPELKEICNLDTEVVYQIFSEDMKPKFWLQMAKKIADVANSGAEGIMIGHGTDTMSYSASALSFLLKNLKVPVVLVGSQRSSDRPSSDAALNLINAARVAGKADLAEVVICMLGSTDHDYGFIHRGTRVRKMHSSVRHTFRTVGSVPLGFVQGEKIHLFEEQHQEECIKKRSEVDNDADTVAADNIEEKVGLIYSYPGMPTDIIDYYIDKGYKGLVLAGTGLGHFPHDCFDSLKRAQEEKIPVVMTVQTLWGYTGMNVYETGREMQDYGVIPGENMLPETAVTKLAWLLGNYNDYEVIKASIPKNFRGEITKREPLNGFQVMQGVEAKIKSMLEKLRK